MTHRMLNVFQAEINETTGLYQDLVEAVQHKMSGHGVSPQEMGFRETGLPDLPEGR